jgi:hypothetical protein
MLSVSRNLAVSLRARSFLCGLASAALWLGAETAHAQSGCTTAQSCLASHADPGCNDSDCCTAVCASDPTCCSLAWDADCVAAANLLCVGYCGAAVNGPCLIAHATAGCNEAACCTNVCASNPFCCDVAWDQTCALYAGLLCPGTPGTCGDPGSCFQPHSTGACSDVACCTAVCGLDPTCCNSSWDQTCVLIAQQVCVANCTPVTLPDAALETEACDSRTNDPCYRISGGTPQVIEANRQLSGKLGASLGNPAGADVDVYTVQIADGDGDGLVRVEVVFASSPKAWAALLVNGTCTPLASALRTVGSELCVDQTTTPVCLPPGNYRIVVSGGTFPTLGGADITCAESNRYTLKVETSEQCSSPCGSATGSCFVPRAAPGCGDAACCVTTCAVDPACCSDNWDEACVASAAALCLQGPPANDACANPFQLAEGVNVFNTLRATTESGSAGASCSGVAFGTDVWFEWTSDTSGPVVLDTCTAWFDTVLSVYTGDCGLLAPVVCSDDSALCGIGYGSRVSFVAACGERYLVKVGTKQGSGSGGEAQLRLVINGPTCFDCPPDLDGSGIVDASDLATMLVSWGTAKADINGDGTTDASDLAALLVSWGPCK